MNNNNLKWSQGIMNYQNDKNVKDDDNNKSDNVNYWPNTNSLIWLRSCDKEVIEPIKGNVTGHIPQWLKGILLRNGPGNLKIGEYQFDHLFDSSALLHRFHILDGKVTYQSRFVQTDVLKKNNEAQRNVIAGFGTRAVPDPCQTIFQKVASIFNTEENMSDNSMISIYPIGDEYYTFTEAPVIHRIDPNTLETKSKVNISNYVTIISHTSHPHIMTDGTVFNVGLSITSRGPVYNVIKFPPCREIAGDQKKKSMFDEATIVASLPARWILNPSYMHTFGITENYFIIVEQPLSIAFFTFAMCQIKKEAMSTCLKWYENENTLIHVVSRQTGELKRTFIAEAFFFFHIINQYETNDGNFIIIDISCYRDAQLINCMYVDAIKNMQKNPDYAELFRGRPLRFVLPLNEINPDIFSDHKMMATQKTLNDLFYQQHSSDNILHQKASAHSLPNGKIFVKPELICDLGCETPRINYDHYLGRKYRYFYAISSDVDIENPGSLIKVDTVEKTRILWNEDDVYPSEPIFVPRPDATEEDDGVIVSAAIFGETKENDVCLLILDGKTMQEIGRATFNTPGPVPKCLHGWFISDEKIMG